jgi:hypothetical protein
MSCHSDATIIFIAQYRKKEVFFDMDVVFFMMKGKEALPLSKNYLQIRRT